MELPVLRLPVLATLLCASMAPAAPLLAQPLPPWAAAPALRGAPAYRPDPSERVPPLLQLDATALLEPPPPPAEPPPQQRPMFSNGWTRDGFGGQPRGWR